MLCGAAGRFVVHVPDQGQIDNLSRDAAAACMAKVSSPGVRPLAVGPLPNATHAAAAPHVARQALIVETALTDRHGPALSTPATAPLLRGPMAVAPMLSELLETNATFKATQGSVPTLLTQPRSWPPASQCVDCDRSPAATLLRSDPSCAP
jgi:alpha-galactosidase/6-phospho-beta-glucosidase family protein